MNKTNCNGGCGFAKESPKKYVCRICGWVYDPAENGGVAFEDLPADWVCPGCGVGKGDFEETYL